MALQVPPEIVCVDCGGVAHLMTREPADGWEPGDVVAYRCSECTDRWDLVVDETWDDDG